MKRKKVELLAPAGSYESMVAAINAGADAVYIGGNRFGARAYADNLDEEAMVRAIDFVHLHGCRIYMTVNTLVKEGELGDLFWYLKPYYEAGLDAVLVQDLGVMAEIHEKFPDLPLHISTQMTVTGKYSAADLKKMGAVRVVPARELSLEEIREIVQSTGLEVETFVHGALCYCYSGQCLFSSLIGGRSGNRGRCAQTCRLPFDVSRDGKYLNRKDERYVLSLKDLNTLDLIPDILEAGVCSLKIEGRMKSPRYTAGVVSIYRKYVDLYLKEGRPGYRVDPKDRETLLGLFDRGGQSEGYYRQHNGKDMVVLKDKPAFREADQNLYKYLDETYGQGVRKEAVKGTAYFAVGKPARLYVEFPLDGDLNPRKKKKAASAASLISWVDGPVIQEAKNAPMDEERIRKQLEKTGDSPFVFEKLSVETEGNIFVPIQALNQMRREALEGLERGISERFRRRLPEAAPDQEKTGTKGEGLPEGRTEGISAKGKGLPEGRKEDISAEGEVFPEGREENNAAKEVFPEGRERKEEFIALVSSRPQFDAVLEEMEQIYKKDDSGSFGIYISSEEFDAGEWKKLADRCHSLGVSCYLMMPRIFRTEAERYFQKNMRTLREAGFDGIGVGSMEEPGFLRQHVPGIPMYFDHGMYTMNHRAKAVMKEYGAARITVPVELNEREILDAGLSGEMIVYGRLPMMVSAQCIRKTVEGCLGKPEYLYLRDRKGKLFPVRNQCRFCCNTIYNESPLSLHGLLDHVKKTEPKALRLNFTTESGAEAAKIFRYFYDEWLTGRTENCPVKQFTRGHFRRGVE